jgi:hypothetical protein
MPHLFYRLKLREHDEFVDEAVIFLGDEQESKLGEVDESKVQHFYVIVLQ